MNKISATFHEDVAAMIEAIPLGKSNAEDVLAWDYEKKGCYIVKSGYRVLMVNEDEDGHQQGDGIENQRKKLIKFGKNYGQ